MEKFEFTSKMVRELKGAPLSCLILMALAGQAVSAQFLERQSGYSDKIVNSALLYLQDNGYITRNERYAWRIAINVHQLPLMVLPDETEPDLPDLGGQLEVIPGSSDENLEDSTTTRNNSESEKFRVPSSSRTIDLTSKELTDPPLLEAFPLTTNVRGCKDQHDPEKLRVAENLAACDRFGIGEPKRSAISKNPKVYPRLIVFHCLDADKLGGAIYRIEHGWKVPKGWKEPIDNSDNIYPENVCAQTFIEPEVEISSECTKSWQDVLESVSSEFKKVEFETWLKYAKLCKVDGDGWTIRVGNKHAADWIKEHALGVLQSAAGVSIKVEW